MPRHNFSFPSKVRNAVREYIDRCVLSIDAKRFNQEPAYVVALIHSLEGIVYEDSDGYIKFTATNIDDRGKGAAEGWFGADFVLTATISNGEREIKKAICVQAKLGTVDEMNAAELDDLKWQIEKMKQFTRSPKIMEIEEFEGVRYPHMASGTKVLEDEEFESTYLSDYVVRRVLTTLDGDTRPKFVEAVQDSSVPTLEIEAYTSIKQ
ncbi:MAG TPA: hypothetical protein PLL77_15850 [Pyrinomonadaceae bacterium]|nr:hypothetical protein [Pyrinomonadaceae bacterium]